MGWLEFYIALSFALSAILMIGIMRVAPDSAFKKSFLVFMFFNTLWIGSNFLMVVTERVFFFRLVHAFGFLDVMSALLWTFNLRNQTSALPKVLSVSAYFLSLVVGVFCFKEGLFFLGQYWDYLDLTQGYGDYFDIYALLASSGMVAILGSLLYTIIREKPPVKTQAFFIFLGMMFSLLFSIVGLILASMGHPEFGYLDSPSSLIFVAATAFTIVKTKLLKIDWIVTKFVSLLICYGLFALCLTAVLVSTFNTALKLLIANLIVIVGVTFGQKLRDFFVTTAKRTFVKGFYDQDHVFNSLSKRIGNEQNLPTLIQTLEMVIDDHLHFEDTCILYALRDQNDQVTAYRLTYHPPVGNPYHKTIAPTDPLISFFSSHRDLIRLQNLDLSVQPFLEEFKCSPQTIIIPLNSLEGLEGLLILGQRSGKLSLRESDVDFLRTIQHFVNAVIHIRMPYEKLEEIVKTQIELQGVLKTVVTLSHEINSPLSSLLMGIGALQRDPSHNSGENVVLQNMKMAVTSISAVIQRLQKIKTLQEVDYLAGIKMIELPKNEMS